MSPLRFGRAIALLLASAGVVIGPIAAVHAAGMNAIVFQRMQQNADGSLRNSSLWLALPSGIRQLTPLEKGERDADGSWSPSGTDIVFEHGAADPDPAAPSDIRIVDPVDQQFRQLTSQAGNFRSPVWGPSGRIAFVSTDRRRNCLSIIQPRGRRQWHLFCVPPPAEMMRPVWAADGRSLFLHAGYYTGSLEPLWRSLVYRIDAETGASFVLFDKILEESRSLEFSPDGSRGIYSDVYTNEMVMVDFATGQLTDVGAGYAPRWSKDGNRIAFTREVFEFDNPPDIRYYESMFVMNADGSGVHRVTQSRLNNHAYTAVEWSNDGTRILANRRIYLDPSLTITRYSLRIIDVTSGAVTVVTDGYAEPGAWREY
jgi:Tol biopolymer transport system component